MAIIRQLTTEKNSGRSRQRLTGTQKYLRACSPLSEFTEAPALPDRDATLIQQRNYLGNWIEHITEY